MGEKRGVLMKSSNIEDIYIGNNGEMNKKSKKGVIIVIFIILVLLLVGMVGAYFYFSNQTLTKKQLFINSISNTNQLIPLKDEIEATQNYIKLRLMRSPNLFSYDFTILNKHLNHLVPKLIIHPIVENAISHGFQKDSKDNHLSITSYEHNGNLFISIYNSGIPISEKAIKEITSFKSNKASHGIGIKNVFRRLQLHEYRSKGGKIFKEKNGTIISLDLGDINQNTTRN